MAQKRWSQQTNCSSVTARVSQDAENECRQQTCVLNQLETAQFWHIKRGFLLPLVNRPATAVHTAPLSSHRIPPTHCHRNGMPQIKSFNGQYKYSPAADLCY